MTKFSPRLIDGHDPIVDQDAAQQALRLLINAYCENPLEPDPDQISQALEKALEALAVGKNYPEHVFAWREQWYEALQSSTGYWYVDRRDQDGGSTIAGVPPIVLSQDQAEKIALWGNSGFAIEPLTDEFADGWTWRILNHEHNAGAPESPPLSLNACLDHLENHFVPISATNPVSTNETLACPA